MERVHQDLMRDVTELQQQLQSSSQRLRRKEAELTRAEETIRREQQQIQKMRQQVKSNHTVQYYCVCRDCYIWYLYSPHTLGNSFSFKVISTSDDFRA